MKKLLSLGTLAAIVVPMTTVIACGTSEKTENPSASSTPMTTISPVKAKGITPVGDSKGEVPKTTVPTNAKNQVIQPVVKPKQVTPQTTTTKLLDRSGKVTSISRNVPWKVEGGNGMNGVKSSITADIYHTNLFDYVVESGSILNGVPIDETMISRMAKIFEANTIIGAGHYSDIYNGINKSISKNFPIQFVKGDGAYSYGDPVGVRMILDKASNSLSTDTSTTLSEDKIMNEAQLMMHEYGHHETMYGGFISMDSRYKDPVIAARSGFPAFQQLEADMKNDPLLLKYTKYFDYQSQATGSQNTLATDRNTPWGVVSKGAQEWGSPDYGYVFSAPEFVTRILSQMETNIDKKYFTGTSAQLDLVDEMAMYTAFGKSPVADETELSHLVDLFKKDVFGLDKSLHGIDTSLNSGDAIINSEDSASGETKFIFDTNMAGWIKNQISKYNLTADEEKAFRAFVDSNKSEITLKLSGDAFDNYPVEYRINKSIKNGAYDSYIISENYHVLKDVPSYEVKVLGSALAKVAKGLDDDRFGQVLKMESLVK